MAELLRQIIGGLGSGVFADVIEWTGLQTLSGGQTLSGTVTDSATTTKTGTFNASGATVTLPTRSAFIDLDENVKGADGAALALSETAGDFFRSVGTNSWYIEGEATVNETEVSVGLVTFVLPENYVSGGTITLDAVCDIDLAGDAALTSATIDFTLGKVSMTDGSAGSDLVTTAATAVTTTAGTKSFTVTPTNLVAGDKLSGSMTSTVIETAGGTGAAAMRVYKVGATVQVNK